MSRSAADYDAQHNAPMGDENINAIDAAIIDEALDVVVMPRMNGMDVHYLT